jgi:hypothetical protein
MVTAQRAPVRFLALVTILSAVGCAGPSPSVSTVGPSPPAGPTQPIAEAPLPDADLEEARQFRVRYGLRADESWIRAVAADPAAQQGVVDYGVPLMPFELLDLESRRTDVDLLRQINDYGGLFPESFAGAYVDQRAAQAFVASFKDDAARHQVALADLLPPEVQVDVRDVDWSTRELNGFVKDVEAEKAWFATIGVIYQDAGRGITEDFVHVNFRGPAEGVQMIEAHFGDPSWLVAERQGPLPWSGPRADLVIDVFDEAGKHVPGLWCEFVPEDPDAAEGGEDTFGTDDSGRCVLRNLPAVPYRITLHRFVDDDHYEPIKTFRVVLAPPVTTVPVVIEAP